MFFPKHCKYVIVPDISYGTWDSLSVTFFANKHDCITNKEWQQEATLFKLQEKTSCLKVNK